MLIKNGNIFTGSSFRPGGIRFSGTVEAIGDLPGEADMDAGGGYVIPGLVDIHTHGALGEDFSDGRPQGLGTLSGWYASNGVTSFLATTMTLKEPELSAAMDAVRDFRRGGGAKCAGVNLEGPFLCYKRRGAQNPENLHRPDAAMFHRLNERSGGAVRLVTVACEEPGAMEFIREVSGTCAVSLGHSDADYDTALGGFRAGASHTTHLFNGMNPLHHRSPGIIGAALDAGASVELICDGLHIHPAVIRAAFRMFGDRVDLISDSLRCAGMPDGDYTLGGQPIRVAGGRATLPDGTLAGSSISLMEGLRRAVSFGIPLEDAVYAATAAPALAARLRAGNLEPGAPADLVVLDRELNIKAVFIDGRPFAPVR